jgi:hypothetical protein
LPLLTDTEKDSTAGAAAYASSIPGPPTKSQEKIRRNVSRLKKPLGRNLKCSKRGRPLV